MPRFFEDYTNTYLAHDDSIAAGRNKKLHKGRLANASVVGKKTNNNKNSQRRRRRRRGQGGRSSNNQPKSKTLIKDDKKPFRRFRKDGGRCQKKQQLLLFCIDDDEQILVGESYYAVKDNNIYKSYIVKDNIITRSTSRVDVDDEESTVDFSWYDDDSVSTSSSICTMFLRPRREDEMCCYDVNCCGSKQIGIPGLLKLLETINNNKDHDEEQKQMGEKDLLSLPKIVDQRKLEQAGEEDANDGGDSSSLSYAKSIYVFENMKLVKSNRWHREYEKKKTDTYSRISYDDMSKGIPHYNLTKDTTWTRRYGGGCPTCYWGFISDYGYDPDGADHQLQVLPQLEYAISLNLKYLPYRIELQNKITFAYDCRDELFTFAPFQLSYRHGYGCKENVTEEQKRTKKMIAECVNTIYYMQKMLKQYIENEARAHIELGLVALCVYKCQLQQLASHQDDATTTWECLKGIVPHASLSAVGIVVARVTPFLLG